MEKLSASEIFALIATVKFERLSPEIISACYPGIENETAFIYEGDYFTLIIDGDKVQLADFEGNFETYSLSLL
jgi:hypothetical protein